MSVGSVRLGTVMAVLTAVVGALHGASAPLVEAAPAAEVQAGGLVGVPPTRLLDTRDPETFGCLGGFNPVRTLRIAPNTRAGVPADAASVVLNVTATRPFTAGYLTIYPAGSPKPTASSLNFERLQTVPNAVTVRLGERGAISIFTTSACVDVIVDVVGYYRDGSPGPGGFVGVTPNRALDTRQGGGCVKGVRNLTVSPHARSGVPAGAGSVVLNVTVDRPVASGYLTVYPASAPRPTASNLNFVRGQTVANAVTVKTGAGGAISLFASGGCPHVIVDVVGYHTAGTPGPGGFVGVTPSRALDTRQGGGCVKGVRNLTVSPHARSGVPAGAGSVVLNVTVDRPVASGYLTVYPASAPRPTASNLNFVRGQTVPNAVTVKTGAGGAISLFASGGCPHVIVDVVGYHTSASPGEFVLARCGAAVQDGEQVVAAYSGATGDWVGIGFQDEAGVDDDADASERWMLARLGGGGLVAPTPIANEPLYDVVPAADGNSAILQGRNGYIVWKRGAPAERLAGRMMSEVISWNGTRLTYNRQTGSSEQAFTAATTTSPEEAISVVGAEHTSARAVSHDGRWVLVGARNRLMGGDEQLVRYDTLTGTSTIVGPLLPDTTYSARAISADGSTIIYSWLNWGVGGALGVWDDGVFEEDRRVGHWPLQIGTSGSEVLTLRSQSDKLDLRVVDLATSAETVIAELVADVPVANASLDRFLVVQGEEWEPRVLCR